MTISGILVATLVTGSLYCLVAIGFVILFRTTAVMNLAQGPFMALGAYLFYTFLTKLNWPFPIAVLGACAVMAAFGAATYYVVFQRLLGTVHWVLAIASLGFGVAIQTAYHLIWGTVPLAMPQILDFHPLPVPWIRINQVDLFAIGSALVVIAVLEVGLARTRIGTRMRAVADSHVLAAFSRIDVTTMSALAWAIAALCAAVAGIAFSLKASLDSTGIEALGFLAFPAIVVGGMDSIRGALVGGFLVAFLGAVLTQTVGGAWSGIAAYVALVAVLLVRPRGLFGSAHIARV
jgi:branched-chain amino acid transport system permease protein